MQEPKIFSELYAEWLEDKLKEQEDGSDERASD